MDNTSKASKPAISRRDFAYYRRRQQNRIYAALAAFFAEEAAKGKITKKRLAEVLQRDPAQITRWLSEPSNLEIDTISDLLLAMHAEMDHKVVRFADRPKANYAHPVIVRLERIKAGVPSKDESSDSQAYRRPAPTASRAKVAVAELEPV